MAPKPPVRESRERLLKDPRVERWYKNRGTRSTASSYLNQLELFLRRNRLDVDGLLSIARAQRDGDGKDQRFADRVLQWVERERKAGRPDAYLATVWAAVRSFLKSNEAAPSWVPKLKVRAATTIADELVPTPEQLRAVLDRNPTLRTRATILLLATSGVRPGVLGSRTSPTGLRLRDLPDLDLRKLAFARTPFRVAVPADLSKGGAGYFTFGTEEAADAIVEYLELRVKRGEKISSASAVIAPEPKSADAHLRLSHDGVAFLSEKGLSQEVRLALRKTQPAGVRWRPYVLRAFASSQLMVAENAKLITRDQREFMLGHATDVGRKYNLGKGRVRTDIEEQVREAYAKAADRFLRILTVGERSGRDVGTLRLVLEVLGVPEGEVSDDELRDATPEKLKEIVRDHLGERPAAHQRVVSNGEIPKLLGEGWTFVATLSPEQVVLKPPEA